MLRSIVSGHPRAAAPTRSAACHSTVAVSDARVWHCWARLQDPRGKELRTRRENPLRDHCKDKIPLRRWLLIQKRCHFEPTHHGQYCLDVPTRRTALDHEGVYIDELLAGEHTAKAGKHWCGSVSEICDRLFFNFAVFAIRTAQEMTHILATDT
jgi:hypothetical protein